MGSITSSMLCIVPSAIVTDPIKFWPVHERNSLARYGIRCPSYDRDRRCVTAHRMAARELQDELFLMPHYPRNYKELLDSIPFVKPKAKGPCRPLQTSYASPPYVAIVCIAAASVEDRRTLMSMSAVSKTWKAAVDAAIPHTEDDDWRSMVLRQKFERMWHSDIYWWIGRILPNFVEILQNLEGANYDEISSCIRSADPNSSVLFIAQHDCHSDFGLWTVDPSVKCFKSVK